MPTARAAARPDGAWAFHLLGFPVSIPWNACIGIGIIAILWYPEFATGSGRIGSWALAGVFAVSLTLSVLVHELAHAISARGFGYTVSGVTLWAMGGYTVYRPNERHGPGKEAVIAVVGPVSTLAIAGLAVVGARVTPEGGVLWSMLTALASANILIGVFNLLPGLPLDGGAVVKSLVWAITGSEGRGQVMAAWIGRGLAVLLAVAPFGLSVATGTAPSLVLVVICLVLAGILWFGASSALKSAKANEELGALRATELARPFRTVDASGTLAGLPTGSSTGSSTDTILVAVDANGTPVGVVNPTAAAAVPSQQRERMGVLTVCARIGTPTSLPVTASAKDVLAACQDSGERFIFVRDDDQPVGIIDTDASFVAEGP